MRGLGYGRFSGIILNDWTTTGPGGRAPLRLEVLVWTMYVCVVAEENKEMSDMWDKKCVLADEKCEDYCLAEPILYCKTTSSYPFQYYFMIYSQFFLFIRYWKILVVAQFTFFLLPVYKIFVPFSLLDSKKNLQNLELSFHSQFLKNSPTPISRTTSARAIFFN